MSFETVERAVSRHESQLSALNALVRQLIAGSGHIRQTGAGAGLVGVPQIHPHTGTGGGGALVGTDGLVLAGSAGGSYSALKTKLDGTTAPGVTDDSASGYAVGSRWIDVTNDKEYVCLDASVGAAVWTETTGGSGTHASTHSNGDSIEAENFAITGNWFVTGVTGAIKVQTASGVPSHTEDEGVLYWDLTGHKLYSSKGGGTWEAVGPGAAAGAVLADGTVPLTASWNPGVFDIGTYDYTARPVKIEIGDAGFFLNIQSSNPTITLESGTYWSYNRTTNQLALFIAAGQICTLSPAGLHIDNIVELTPDAGIILDGVKLKDSVVYPDSSDVNIFFTLSAGNAILQGDTDGWWLYDRGLNIWTCRAGGANILGVSVTGISVDGDISVTGTVDGVDIATNVIRADGTIALTADWDNIGRRIRNTGVAEVAAAAPSTPATGLIWLDTDATGTGGLGVLNVTTITTSTTLTTSQTVVLCDASSGAITVTLPAASANDGRHYHIKKVDSSGNAVTIDGNGSETIDGETTQVITMQYNSINVVCDGSAWYIL